MKKRLAPLLAVVLLVIVSTGHAWAKVSIGDEYNKTIGEEVIISVDVKGYTPYWAGQYVLDLGQIKPEDLKVLTEGSSFYPKIIDYSTVSSENAKQFSNWYQNNDAAVDYVNLGSICKVYLVAKEAQKEKGDLVGDGTLLKFKFKVGQNSKSSPISFSGYAMNNTLKVAIGDSALFNVGSEKLVPIDLTTKTEPVKITGNEVVDLKDLKATGGAVPVTVTMENTDKTSGEAALTVPQGVTFTTAEGFLAPPVVKDYTKIVNENASALLPKLWQDKQDAVTVSIGPAQKLELAQNQLMLLKLKVKLKTTKPRVYYLEPNKPPVLAGVEGTWEGKKILKGGSIESQASSGGVTEYTISVLINHLSTYAVGEELEVAAIAPVPEGDGGTCFIATAAFGSASDWHVKSLRDFRDAYLLKSSWGKAFVDAYYKHSPSIALYLKEHDLLRSVVRAGLVPVAGFAYVAVYYPVLLLIGLIFVIGIVAVGVTTRRR